MAELSVVNQNLMLALSGWEKAGSLRRSDVVVPLGAIASVQRLANARHGIRGVRVPGTGFPGVIALGTWRTRRAKDFVAVYRNDPGYLIALDGEQFDRIVASSPEIPELEALVD